MTRSASFAAGAIAVVSLSCAVARAQAGPPVPLETQGESAPVPVEPQELPPQLPPPPGAVPPDATSSVAPVARDSSPESERLLGVEALVPPEGWQDAREPAPVHFDVPETENPRIQRRWYGWQTFASDAGALGLIFAGASSPSASGLATTGVLLYAVGPPVIHAAHDHTGKALGSFVLRLGAPVAGGALGYAIDSAQCSSGEWFCGVAGLALGIIVGAGTASLFDGFALANEDVPAPTRTGFRLAPAVSVLPGHYSAGVVGSF